MSLPVQALMHHAACANGLPIFFDAPVDFTFFDAHLFFHGVLFVVLHSAQQLLGIAFLLFLLRLLLFLLILLERLLLLLLLRWLLLLWVLLVFILLLVLVLLLILLLLVLILLLRLCQHLLGIGEVVFGILVLGIELQRLLIVLHGTLKLLHATIVLLLSHRHALLCLSLHGLTLLQTGLQMAVGKVVVGVALIFVGQLRSVERFAVMLGSFVVVFLTIRGIAEVVLCLVVGTVGFQRQAIMAFGLLVTFFLIVLVAATGVAATFFLYFGRDGLLCLYKGRRIQ